MSCSPSLIRVGDYRKTTMKITKEELIRKQKERREREGGSKSQIFISDEQTHWNNVNDMFRTLQSNPFN